MTALIHLIAGSTGAGKTTYALALGKRIGGVRFSIDEWMATLFWPDSPQPIEAAWTMERIERCYRQIWATAVPIAATGTPCILDLGFTRRDSRARFLALAREAGFTAQLHSIDVPADERWRRVAARNAGASEIRHLPFEITRDLFDFVESLWEPPTDAELAAAAGVKLASGNQ